LLSASQQQATSLFNIIPKPYVNDMDILKILKLVSRYVRVPL